MELHSNLTDLSESLYFSFQSDRQQQEHSDSPLVVARPLPDALNGLDHPVQMASGSFEQMANGFSLQMPDASNGLDHPM